MTSHSLSATNLPHLSAASLALPVPPSGAARLPRLASRARSLPLLTTLSSAGARHAVPDVDTQGSERPEHRSHPEANSPDRPQHDCAARLTPARMTMNSERLSESTRMNHLSDGGLNQDYSTKEYRDMRC